MSPRNSYSGISSSLEAIVSKKAKELCHYRYFIEADLEDLQQELIIHLNTAIKAYDLEKKEKKEEEEKKTEKQKEAEKRAFAKTVVDNKASDLIEYQLCQKRGSEVLIYSLHDSIGDDEDYLLIDTISSDSTFYDYNEATESCDAMEFELDLEQLLESLPNDLRNLYELLQNKHINEILQETEMSRATFYRKIKILRKIFSDSGFFN